MKVVVAPDSFKGTYSASDVAAAIAAGLRETGVDAVEVPLADGGEGTLDALRKPMQLELVDVQVSNPWGSPVRASYGLSLDGVAVIESAAAAGLHTVHPGPRDPVLASTRGVGQLIMDASDRGAIEIVVGLGGTATTDGGLGAIRLIEERGGCRVPLRLLVDVEHTFVDAARVFAPQKGADPAQVEHLQARLEQLAQELPHDPTDVPGTGAAGGLAGGLWARYGASIEQGAEFVIDQVGVVRGGEVDAFVTGEGRLDDQSSRGKLVSAVVRRAAGVPVHAVVGSVSPDIGSFVEVFASVAVATDRRQMRAAGASLGTALVRLDRPQTRRG